MQVKNELRKKYKEIRKNVENRNEKNTLINDFLCNSDCFKNCDTVLFYAALSDEVNLDFSIKYAIDNNKKVALPVCIDNNGKMQYYYIDSLNDIEIASFGVREPDVNKCKEVDDFSKSICIVPAIVNVCPGIFQCISKQITENFGQSLFVNRSQQFFLWNFYFKFNSPLLCQSGEILINRVDDSTDIIFFRIQFKTFIFRFTEIK